MSSDSEDRSARIIPYLYYEDVAAAVEWLTAAFGFRELAEQTMRSPEGNVVHSAIELEGGVVMMGHPGPAYQSPKRAKHVVGNLYVRVSDVEAHYQRAKQAGAVFVSDLEETFYGDRRYGAEDLEGHHWYFAQRVQAVDPKDWKPTGKKLNGRG